MIRARRQSSVRRCVFRIIKIVRKLFLFDHASISRITRYTMRCERSRRATVEVFYVSPKNAMTRPERERDRSISVCLCACLVWFCVICLRLRCTQQLTAIVWMEDWRPSRTHRVAVQQMPQIGSHMCVNSNPIAWPSTTNCPKINASISKRRVESDSQTDTHTQTASKPNPRRCSTTT